MSKGFFGAIVDIFRYRFNLDEDKAAEDEIISNIKKGVEFQGINLWTLIFAILIAAIGLNVNSTAVIIGAMLISPLMGPIMGIGLGAGIYDFQLIKHAAKNLLVASLIGLATSTVYFLISPLHHAQSELLARTSPTIWDVLIAFFGGLSGIVASSRTKYNNVIPGVAIATALMPPLCTAGFGIANAQWSFFFGAFYLYLINSVFISIATFLMVRFLKFSTYKYIDDRVSIKVKRWVGIIAVLTIIPSIYLAYRFVNNEIFRQNANRLINDEMLANGLTVLNNNINPESKTIEMSLLDRSNLDSIRDIIEIKKEKYNLSDAIIKIKGNSNIVRNELDMSEIKEGIVEDLFVKQEALLNQKTEEINSLKANNILQAEFENKKSEAIEEFVSLYGEPKELIIEKTIMHNNFHNDTVLLVFVNNSKTRLNKKETEKMQDWLKTKFKMSTIKLVIN